MRYTQVINRSQKSFNHRLRLSRSREDKSELLAAIPRNQIRLADDRLECLSHFLQSKVTFYVAITVVELLEAVDIDQTHAEWSPRGSRTNQSFCQLVVKMSAIGNPRERVFDDKLRQGCVLIFQISLRFTQRKLTPPGVSDVGYEANCPDGQSVDMLQIG